MIPWYIAASIATGALCIGLLLGLVGAYLYVESFCQLFGIRENRNATTEDTAEPYFDPEEDRRDLLAIRDLLTASTIVGGFNGGEDSNLRHALGELREATHAARDRFADLLDDLDDEAADDAAEKVAADA